MHTVATASNYLVFALACALLTACGGGKFDLSDNQAQPLQDPSSQQDCADKNPQRNAYFGDLHVHTGYSADGWMFGVRTTPQDAYRYAFGGEVLLPPNNASGTEGTRSVRIDRPLDFMGVTDHSEFYGEGRICTNDNFAGYDSDYCQEYRASFGRNFTLAMAMIAPYTWRNGDLCGEDGEHCKKAARSVWEDTIAAAQDWDDSSDSCERSTFIAYEYSSVRLGSNLHRNVVFRNTTVPRLPVSTIEAPRHWQLWEALQRDCLDAPGDCDVLAIPHNSNISNGRMFAVDYPGTGSLDEQRARAALRIRLEPIVEVMQHKGDSECRNGLPHGIGQVDELCEFEKFDRFALETTNIFGGDIGACSESAWSDIWPNLGPSCLSPLSYIRGTLVEGLKEEERLGVNPFKFGLSASTDTHNGLGGGVAEKTFPGHLGLGDETVKKRVSWNKEYAGNASNNPGGLIGVWASENSRDALFDAMTRKEVFGTSGPRIQPRLFGGWDYDASLCSDPDLLQQAYAGGVPMGGDLPLRGQATAPVFIATGLSDVGTIALPGTPLQRLQIIKGWVDADGVNHEKVFDVAGDADNGASVDLDSCALSGSGFAQLCGVWTDPEFNPRERAVYYMRAVENPSCRYTAWQCAELPAEQRPADCADSRSRAAIQERAWTSPIWYTPEAGG